MAKYVLRLLSSTVIISGLVLSMGFEAKAGICTDWLERVFGVQFQSKEVRTFKKNLEDLLEGYQREVELFEPNGRLGCASGGCSIYGKRIFDFLKREPFLRPTLKLISTGNDKHVKVPGIANSVAHGHVFITVREPITGTEIIIDPTYLQFVNGGHKLDAPLVFVGTAKDLEKFYAKHSQKLTFNWEIPAHVYEGVTPEQFVSIVYGFDGNSRQIKEYASRNHL